MPGNIGPIGVSTGKVLKRRCATHELRRKMTSQLRRRHCAGVMRLRILTVSPVLHMAVLSNQPSFERQGTSRGSHVSGRSERHVGIGVFKRGHVSGNRLLSVITATPGFATGVW